MTVLLQVGDDKVAGSFEGRVARLRTDLGTERPLATLFWQSVWSLGDLQGLEGGAFVLLPQITEAPVAAPVRGTRPLSPPAPAAATPGAVQRGRGV